MTEGEAKKVLNLRNIPSHLFVHRNLKAFFNSCMMGLVFFSSFGTNLECVVSRSVTLWIYLTFSGFAFMPR